MTESACELCGGSERVALAVGSDYTNTAPGPWTIARCRECTLVRIDPLPTPDQIPSFYRVADYQPHTATPKTFRAVAVSPLKRAILRHRYGYPGGGRRRRWKTLAAVLASPLISLKYVIPWTGDGELLDIGAGKGAAL